MTFNPLIPQANNLISDSQSDILNNFTQQNTVFDNDHYTFNFATSANRGLHRKISFPASLGSDPALAGNAGYIFLKDDTNDTSLRPQVFYKNNTETLQVTNRFHSAANSGYIQLPGGIIMMWGNVNIPASPTSDQILVTFPTMANHIVGAAGFPTALFNVQFSLKCSSSASLPTVCIGTSSFSTTGFQIRYSSGQGVASTCYWYAIGN